MSRDCNICFLSVDGEYNSAEPSRIELSHPEKVETEANDATLSCGHLFHYDCIALWYKKSRDRICPYCRGNGGYLKFVNGMTYDKELHHPWHCPPLSTINYVQCQAMTKRGNQCRNRGKPFCGKHLKSNN